MIFQQHQIDGMVGRRLKLRRRCLQDFRGDGVEKAHALRTYNLTDPWSMTAVGRAMMFGSKDKQASGLKIANSFDIYEVERSLTGEWLTLALSRFEQKYTSRHDRKDWDFPTAIGVVHFETGTNFAVPAQLTLIEDEAAERGKTGVAHYDSRNDGKGGTEIIILEVAVKDADGKIAQARQDAFTSAAISEERFVHVSFRRAKMDPAEFIPELIEKRYGAYHDLIEIDIKRRTHLAKTPAWSWLWKREY